MIKEDKTERKIGLMSNENIKAELVKSGMQPEENDELHNPGQDHMLEDPSPLLCSLRHFVNNSSALQKHYENLRAIEHMCRPDDPMLSFDQVKQHVCWLSGVVPVEHNMCVKSCLAFIAPCKSLNTCSHCGKSHYCPGSTKPQKCFTTIPIGPVIQVMYSSQVIVDSMHYMERKLTNNVEHARLNGRLLDNYDDTTSGQALLDAWHEGFHQAQQCCAAVLN